MNYNVTAINNQKESFKKYLLQKLKKFGEFKTHHWKEDDQEKL